jgi:hypothetical protein
VLSLLCLSRSCFKSQAEEARLLAGLGAAENVPLPLEVRPKRRSVEWRDDGRRRRGCRSFRRCGSRCTESVSRFGLSVRSESPAPAAGEPRLLSQRVPIAHLNVFCLPSPLPPYTHTVARTTVSVDPSPPLGPIFRAFELSRFRIFELSYQGCRTTLKDDLRNSASYSLSSDRAIFYSISRESLVWPTTRGFNSVISS